MKWYESKLNNFKHNISQQFQKKTTTELFLLTTVKNSRKLTFFDCRQRTERDLSSDT